MQKLAKDIIKVKNIYVIYNHQDKENAHIAVKNFSFNFQQGKIYCIIGESGSGKSSLISTFNVLKKPKYGSIQIIDDKVEAKKTLHNVLISKYLLERKDGQNKFLLLCANHSKIEDLSLALKSNNVDNFKIKKASLTKDLKKHLIEAKHLKKFEILTVNNLNFIENYTLNSKIKSIDCLLNKKSKKKVKNYQNIRKNIGMVYQFPEIQLFKTTVLADVTFAARIQKYSKDEAYKMAVKSLNLVGLDEKYLNDSPFSLSGGQKRRVALASIFITNPNILVFDEPTAGLDPQSENEMIEYMLKFKKQHKTIFVVTHSMDQVLSIADEILVMHKGELIASGKPYDIFLDKKTLSKTCIEQPLVIKTILNLIKKDSKFKELLIVKPKNINELANAILKIKKGKGW